MARSHSIRRIAALTIVATVASIVAIAQPAQRVDAAKLVADVEALSAPAMEGRRTGTPGSHRAQAFILGRFRDLGLKPFGAGYEQPFSFAQRGGGSLTAANLVGMVRGTARPDEFLLLSGHFSGLLFLQGSGFLGAHVGGFLGQLLLSTALLLGDASLHGGGFGLTAGQFLLLRGGLLLALGLGFLHACFGGATSELGLVRGILSDLEVGHLAWARARAFESTFGFAA